MTAGDYGTRFTGRIMLPLILSLFFNAIIYTYAQLTPCGSINCDPKATCSDPATSSCACNAGYRGDGQYCFVDLDALMPGSCNVTLFPEVFQCIDGTCISIFQQRDTYPDCAQVEDEECSASDGNIKCDVNICTPVADVITFCTEQIYKLYCLYFNMTPSFTCLDDKICMPYEWVNNGQCNCDDCSDEFTTTTVTFSTTSSVAPTTTTAASTSTTTSSTTLSSTSASTTSSAATTTVLQSTSTTPTTTITTTTVLQSTSTTTPSPTSTTTSSTVLQSSTSMSTTSSASATTASTTTASTTSTTTGSITTTSSIVSSPSVLQSTSITSPSTTTVGTSTVTLQSSTTLSASKTSSQSTSSASASTTTASTTSTTTGSTTTTKWLNPFIGDYGACWESYVSNSKQTTTYPLCPCVGNRVKSSNGNCEFNNNTFTMKLKTQGFCNDTIQWSDNFKDVTSSAFMDMATLVYSGFNKLISNNVTMVKSFCVASLPMSQGSVVTDVLVQVDSSSGFSASQAAQALTDGLAGLSGTLGSGLSSASITDTDECTSSTLNECSTYSTCTNTFGSYSCVCNSDYTDKSPTGARSGTLCKKTCSSGWNIDDTTCFPVWALVLLILFALLLLLCCLIACCCWLCNRKKHGKGSSGPMGEQSQQTEADPENGIYPPTDRVLTPPPKKDAGNGGDDRVDLEEERPLTQADNARSGPIEEKPPTPPGTVPADNDDELYEEPPPPVPPPGATKVRKKKGGKRNEVSPSPYDDDDPNGPPPGGARQRARVSDDAADRGQRAGRSRRNDDPDAEESRGGGGRSRSRNPDRNRGGRPEDENDDRQRGNRGRSRSRNPEERDKRDRSSDPRDNNSDRGRDRSRGREDRNRDRSKGPPPDDDENQDGGQGNQDGGGSKSPRKQAGSGTAVGNKGGKGGPPPKWQHWSLNPGGFSNDKDLLDI